MAIRGEKFLGLCEQALNADKSNPAQAEGAGLPGYKRTIRRMLGIVEGTEGSAPRIDHAAREFGPRSVSMGELWHAFKPHGFTHSDMRSAMQRVEAWGLAEAEGHVVLPSHFSNISAFSATVAGLLDAMIIEGFTQPQFKGDDFMPSEDSRMNGGAAIGIMNDGEAGDDLANGEAYPTVGLKESKVTIPENRRRGNTIQINELDFVYDRTGKIQESATNAGVAVRRLKEISQAKAVLGLAPFNGYTRDGNTGTTYQKTAGFVPVNYVNSVGSLPLAGFATIDTATITLASNRDPGTGFEIDIPKPIQIAVMPMKFLNLMTITRATEVETRTTDQTVIRRAPNPLYSVDPIELPMLWYNLLVASGVSTTNAAERWLAGDFKRAFRYRQIIPFESKEAPLSSEDVRKDIVMVRVAREIGTPFVLAPWYTFAGTNEA